MIVPVASALTGTHRDYLAVASFGQEPEIQPLVSRGQIISADLPLLIDGQTHNYNSYIYSYDVQTTHMHMYPYKQRTS